MFKIIKYDFIRKYKLILIILIAAVFLNLLAIVKFSVQGGVMFLGLFPIAMILLYIVDIIKMYSDDLNKKSGYMLFMTSYSGYKIIVSKLITAILEAIAILLLYLIFILINSIYFSTTQGFDLNVNEIISAVNTILSGRLGFNLGHVFVFLLTVLVFATGFILTAYTSITIRKSIFSETKFGGVLSFIIFIALNWASSFSSSKLMSILPPYYDISGDLGQISATQLIIALLPIIILSVVESILMTLGSGYLLEKRINL